MLDATTQPPPATDEAAAPETSLMAPGSASEPTLVADDTVNMEMVTAALRRTSQAMRGIDDYLGPSVATGTPLDSAQEPPPRGSAQGKDGAELISAAASDGKTESTRDESASRPPQSDEERPPETTRQSDEQMENESRTNDKCAEAENRPNGECAENESRDVDSESRLNQEETRPEENNIQWVVSEETANALRDPYFS